MCHDRDGRSNRGLNRGRMGGHRLLSGSRGYGGGNGGSRLLNRLLNRRGSGSGCRGDGRGHGGGRSYGGSLSRGRGAGSHRRGRLGRRGGDGSGRVRGDRHGGVRGLRDGNGGIRRGISCGQAYGHCVECDGGSVHSTIPDELEVIEGAIGCGGTGNLVVLVNVRVDGRNVGVGIENSALRYSNDLNDASGDVSHRGGDGGEGDGELELGHICAGRIEEDRVAIQPPNGPRDG